TTEVRLTACSMSGRYMIRPGPAQDLSRSSAGGDCSINRPATHRPFHVVLGLEQHATNRTRDVLAREILVRGLYRRVADDDCRIHHAGERQGDLDVTLFPEVGQGAEVARAV